MLSMFELIMSIVFGMLFFFEFFGVWIVFGVVCIFVLVILFIVCD